MEHNNRPSRQSIIEFIKQTDSYYININLSHYSDLQLDEIVRRLKQKLESKKSGIK